jgi:hypothetical protein
VETTQIEFVVKDGGTSGYATFIGSWVGQEWPPSF